MRRLLGVILGILAGGLVVYACERIGHTLYPPPEGMDLTKPEAVRALMELAPVGSLLFVVAGYLLGASAAGVVSVAVGRSAAALWIVFPQSLLFLATAANLFMIPHPVWMSVASVLVYPLSFALVWWGAGRLLGRPSNRPSV